MSSVFFSVIIPVFNRERTIQKAIDSVIEQSFTNFELIIINDGSTDSTKDILEKLPNNIKIIHQENHGVSHARNRGIESAQGEFIAFLDSDDYWHKEKLKKQYDYLQQNPNSKILHCDEVWIRNGKRVNPRKIHQKAGGDQFIRSMQLCCISPSAVVIKKEVLNEFNGFLENYPVCEDYDLWLKITYKYQVDYIDEMLITKTGGHDDQLSSKYKAMDWWRLQSLVTYLKQPLDEDKKNALLSNIHNRIEVLRKGYEKHQKDLELEKLNQLLSEYKLN